MNVTLSLEDDLVKKVRKIAVERDTTLTGMVREYLKSVADEEQEAERKQRQLAALERSFEELSFPMGERDWCRQDLYDRPAMKRWFESPAPGKG